MPVPFWAGHYIGLPFRDHGRDASGLDCWGLVRLVMAEQRGVALPSFATSYKHSTDTDGISRLIGQETQNWRPIAAGHEQEGDVIVLRVRGKPMHVGMVLGDRHMLHVEYGVNSTIDRYDRPRWAERICGFYRYISGFKKHD